MRKVIAMVIEICWIFTYSVKIGHSVYTAVIFIYMFVEALSKENH